RRRHTRFSRDWSSDVCSSDLNGAQGTQVTFEFVNYNGGRLFNSRIHGFPTLTRLHQAGCQNLTQWRCQTQLTQASGVEFIILDRSEERRVGKEDACGLRRQEY